MVAEPEKVILFGSMADGTANRFSDVDLLIITENADMKQEIASRIVSYTHELSLKSDVLVYSISEMEKQCEQSNSFIAAIIKSGEVVYEKNCI